MRVDPRRSRLPRLVVSPDMYRFPDRNNLLPSFFQGILGVTVQEDSRGWGSATNQSDISYSHTPCSHRPSWLWTTRSTARGDHRDNGRNGPCRLGLSNRCGPPQRKRRPNSPRVRRRSAPYRPLVGHRTIARRRQPGSSFQATRFGTSRPPRSHLTLRRSNRWTAGLSAAVRVAAAPRPRRSRRCGSRLDP